MTDMADRQDYSQSELFTQDMEGGGYKPHNPGKPFFTRIRGYEKVLLVIMGMVLLGLVSFSFGVESARRRTLPAAGNTEASGYTIQVGAFKNRAQALRHAQLLAAKGLAPLAFAKGSYIILCVGKFSNQESAQPLLNQLQKTYAGCRIRRL